MTVPLPIRADGGYKLAGTAGNKLALNVDELGFGADATRVDPQRQKQLDLRSHMLRTHQQLGLWTAGAMALTFFTAGGSKALHATYGAATTGLYFTTAFYAIHAPDVEGIPHTGATKWHRRLAFIHVPAMIATPILGALAKNQRDHGENVHGIAHLHPLVGTIAFTTFLASIVVVSINLP
jgi:hypothetical protein